MVQKMYLELFLPEKLLFSEEVEMVVLPGSEGDFGVLVNHAPMLSTMRSGIVTIYRAGQVAERIFVTGGFVEITGVVLTVLVVEVFTVDSMDNVNAKLRLSLT